MAFPDIKDFSSKVARVTMEEVKQRVELFNAASGGGFVLSTENMSGSFALEAAFASLEDAGSVVDITGTNGSLPATPITQGDNTGVKFAMTAGAKWQNSAMNWNGYKDEEIILFASNGLAKAMFKTMVNAAIGAAVGAIGNDTALVNDESTNPLTYNAVNKAHYKMGDAQSNLVVDVMHSAAEWKLKDTNLNNAQQLFDWQGVRVINILGKRILVTDSPHLFDPITGIATVISLVTQGVAVMNSTLGGVYVGDTTANEQTYVETVMKSEGSAVMRLKGFGWNTATKSPEESELATGANWVPSFANNPKNAAGVLTKALAN